MAKKPYVKRTKKKTLKVNTYYNLNKKVNMLLKSREHKQLDVSSLALSVVDGVGIQTQLTNLTQGDTNITREGNQITAESIYIKLMFHIAAAASSSQIRCLLVHDKQSNGAAFATTDLLESVTNIRSLITPRNLDNIKRFQVLYDKIIVLNQNVASAISTTRFIKIYKKLGINLRYDGNAGDITDLTQSALSLLFISNEATNEPTVDVDSRIRFIDN